jgi:hypothetical protein
MSVTIDSLDIQIRSSAGSAAKNIGELASSLERLKKHSKLTTVSNQLTKLSAALSQLQVSSSTVGTIKGLAGALKSLSGIQKSAGLNSTINSLKKLPDVVNALDPATITAFSTSMRKLSDGLSPLATQIEKIGNGFSKLPPQVSKCVTAVKRLDSANKSAAASTKGHGEALNAQSLNFMTAYENLSNVFSIIHGIQDAFARVLNGAIQWDGIQFQFGRAFGEDAEKVLAYAEKVSDALEINKQQFMESASLYGSLLSGFGVEQKQVTTMAVGLAELSYDIWAAYNNRYKTLDDASEAVRSAITGEIEPIRNAGIALTEASMQEYLDSIGMAHISMEKLTEAQKSEVRYATMVNAAMNQGIIGTYAREMETAEGAIRTLTQQLTTLGQAFGSLFIPMLKVVIPWLTAFVQLVTEGVIALGAMFGIKFQEITWGDAAGMKQTAEGANATKEALGGAAKNAKKMMDYTMGFDELNVIDPPSDSGAAGGAGAAGAGGGGSLGLDLETLWDNAVLESASKQIDELKEKIKAYIAEHKVMLSVVGGTAAFLGFMKALRGLNSLLGITKTVGNLTTAFTALSAVISKVFSGKLMDLFPKSWFANFTSGIKMLKDGHISFQTFLAGITGGMKTQNFAASAADMFLRLGGALKNGLARLPSLLVQAVRAIPGWGWVITAIAGLITLAVVDYDFTDIGYKIGNALGTVLKWGMDAIVAVGTWIEALGLAIDKGAQAALDWVMKNFDMKSITKFIVMMFNPIVWIREVVPKMVEIGNEVLPGLMQGIKDGWNNFWGNVKEFIDGFVKGFKDALGIHSPSTVFAEIGDNIIAGLLNGVTKKWEAVKGWFKTNVVPKLTVDYWKEKFSGIKQGAEAKLDEVKQAFTNKWSAITSWFNTNVAPKFTLDYWKAKFDVLKQAVTTKLDEVRSEMSAKWALITKWFADNIAPKFTLRFWLDKFKNLKEGFTQTVKNMLNAGIDMLNKFIGWLNSKLSFSWDGLSIAGKEIYPGGSVQLLTIPQITQRFAGGGFIEDGLFTMNHGEIAGKFSNGQSVVANNQQIVEGIAAGVYEAVVAAMNATSGRNEQNVNVYLDGRQITAAVEKRQSERGRQLLGNQLGYAY